MSFRRRSPESDKAAGEQRTALTVDPSIREPSQRAAFLNVVLSGYREVHRRDTDVRISRRNRASGRRDATAMHITTRVRDEMSFFSQFPDSFWIIIRDVISCLYINVYTIYIYICVASHCALHCDSARRAISALEADRKRSPRSPRTRVHSLANIIGSALLTARLLPCRAASSMRSATLARVT